MESFAPSSSAQTLIPSTTLQVDRRMSLLQATFDEIASNGFEGLRTRSVAERASVNIATLHYYFPTKEELIKGLAEFLSKVFATLHAPSPPSTGYRAIDHLRQEFADTRFYREHHPQFVNVLEEMGSRAKRDPSVRAAMDEMTISWRGWIKTIVQTGLAEGSFRADLDPDETISMLMAILAGALIVEPNSLENVQRGVEAWLVKPKIQTKLKEV